MNIQLLCIGKLKETYLVQGCKEYIKRLTPYANLKITELPEAKGRDPLSPKEVDQLLTQEAKRIHQVIHPNTYLIVLTIDGQSVSSVEFAKQLDRLPSVGHSHITFVIGGSYGCSSEIIQRANQRLSFSSMTFPHQLMRLILLEQIYRAFKINRGETYHK